MKNLTPVGTGRDLSIIDNFKYVATEHRPIQTKLDSHLREHKDKIENNNIFSTQFRGHNLRTGRDLSLQNAAMPLILLMLQLKNLTTAPTDVAKIYQQAQQEINIFTHSMQLQYPSSTVLAASYCLCSAVDEAILSTNWGAHSQWMQHTLLSAIHQETWGGERFYLILKTMTEMPANHLDLLELLFALLSVGFEGQYFNDQTGIHEEIRHSLFNLIVQHRPILQKTFTSIIKPTVPRSLQIISPRYFGLIAAGILFLTWCGANYSLHHQAAPLLEKLQYISNKS